MSTPIRFLLLSIPALLVGCGTSNDGPKGTALSTDGLADAIDGDNDGYLSSEDCNDGDSAVNPAAVELCDGVDNNCDGNVDEGVTDPYWPDADGDGYGDEGSTPTEACEPPSGYVPNADDCNDADVAYNPDADESDCTDPNDYNCDGSVGYADADGDGYPACEDGNDAEAWFRRSSKSFRSISLIKPVISSEVMAFSSRLCMTIPPDHG